MSKRTYYLDKDGRPVNLKFHYDQSLADFNGDGEAMAQDLDLYQDQYEEIERTLPPGKPHEMAYPDGKYDPRYESDQRVFEMAQANYTARQAWELSHPPKPPQPRPLSPIERVLLDGNAKDKTEMRERLSLQKEAERALKEAAFAESMGDISKARDFNDRAAHLIRQVDSMAKKYTFSVEQKDREGSIAWGEERLREMQGWSPEIIKENISEVESLCQGFRDMSDAQYSYLVDYGSPYSKAGKEGATFKVVKINHPGTPANSLQAKTGMNDPEKLLDHAHRVGYSMEIPPDENPDKDYSKEFESSLRTGEPAPAPTPAPEPQSQAAFEAQREAEGAPRF